MGSDDSDGSGRSTGSAKSCIFALLPEDLAAACTADCTPEQCDNATVRPREPPEVEPGIPGQFVPFEVPQRPAEVRSLPPQPLDLLLEFVPASVVGRWVKWTDAAPRSARLSPVKKYSRSLK
ncbi:hypothetical protein CLIM01_14995 [Colletotrichum limetticola]|uniref:Uncharacterized protein n=1 Tax=Colletotrichum limetticola TaxID=1209924 RepID=A0ABQ9P6I1_9PEZI|nr:hypothetical protein CLIM01_14995 [Colletotrichum limetticola]